MLCIRKAKKNRLIYKIFFTRSNNGKNTPIHSLLKNQRLSFFPSIHIDLSFMIFEIDGQIDAYEKLATNMYSNFFYNVATLERTADAQYFLIKHRNLRSHGQESLLTEHGLLSADGLVDLRRYAMSIKRKIGLYYQSHNRSKPLLLCKLVAIKNFEYQ